MKSTGTIVLDFTRKGLEQILEVTQYDTGRVVECCIFKVNGEISMAQVYCSKPSGLEAYVNAEIVDDNKVKFIIDPQMIAEEGDTKCQVQLNGEGKTLTSFEFTLRVRKNMVASSRITSCDTYPALQKLLERFSELYIKEISTEEIDALEGS